MSTRMVVLSLIFTCCVGCGGGGESFDRIDVSGDVTFNGKPLAAGQVRFSPVSGDKAAVSLAIVKDGKYQTAPGAGPSKGNYDVSVIVYGEPNGEDDDNVLGTYEETATISETETNFSYSFDQGELMIEN